MKNLASILSIYILSLAIAPSAIGMLRHFSAGTCTEMTHSCCKKNTESKPKEERNPMNCCNSGACNPFASCCFFFHTNSSCDLRSPAISNVIGAAEPNELISSYSSDCFRPPEVV